MKTVDPFFYIAERLYRLLPHAMDQMANRSISRKMVSEIILKGLHFNDPNRPSTCMEFHSMRVVVDLKCNPAQIISVMHTRTNFRDSY